MPLSSKTVDFPNEVWEAIARASLSRCDILCLSLLSRNHYLPMRRVLYLLEYNENGPAVLFESIRIGATATVMAFIDCVPESVSAIEPGVCGYSVVSAAAMAMQFDLMMVLFYQRGAPVAYADCMGRSVLHEFCRLPHRRAEFRMRAEIIVALADMGVALDKVDDFGYTAISCCIEDGDYETARVLYEHGAALGVGQGCRFQDGPSLYVAVMQRGASNAVGTFDALWSFGVSVLNDDGTENAELERSVTGYGCYELCELYHRARRGFERELRTYGVDYLRVLTNRRESDRAIRAEEIRALWRQRRGVDKRTEYS